MPNTKIAYAEYEEELITEAIAWKHALDTGKDYEKISRIRRRLRATDIQELMWEFENAII